ncbi:MAG: hypothetical protein RJA70_196 [Pseudomonadota bacterium]|jgi:hypothetical protein
MLPFEDRYTRQRQVPEIGTAGQTLLEGSRITLPDIAASAVAVVYLERAGVRQIDHSASSLSLSDPGDPCSDPLETTPHARHFRFSGPLEFAQGCQLALNHIRRQLNLDTRNTP